MLYFIAGWACCYYVNSKTGLRHADCFGQKLGNIVRNWRTREK